MFSEEGCLVKIVVIALFVFIVSCQKSKQENCGDQIDKEWNVEKQACVDVVEDPTVKLPVLEKIPKYSRWSKITQIQLPEKLPASTFISIGNSFDLGRFYYAGDCVHLMDLGSLSIAVKSYYEDSYSLCDNTDENTDNDCKGNYNLIYDFVSSSEAETLTEGEIKLEKQTKLKLESRGLDKSKSCLNHFPIYTVRVNVDIVEGYAVKVQNKFTTKKLTKLGQCIKLIDEDFEKLQIVLEKNDKVSDLLCGDSKNPCGNKINYTITSSSTDSVLADSVLADSVKSADVSFSLATSLSKSENCQWLFPPSEWN